MMAAAHKGQNMSEFRVLSTVLCAILFSLQPATARVFMRGTPMPDRPGCHETHCMQLWDEELQIPFRRCYWRCPRPRPAPAPREWVQPRVHPAVPDPPRYRYRPPVQETPQYRAPAPSVSFPEVPGELLIGFFLLIALIVVIEVVFRHFRALSLTRNTDRAFSDAAALAAAKARLAQATRDADELIQRQAASAFRRGRHSSE